MIRAFNGLYYRLQNREGPASGCTTRRSSIPSTSSAIGTGCMARGGFFQYQCVVPPSAAERQLGPNCLPKSLARAAASVALRPEDTRARPLARHALVRPRGRHAGARLREPRAPTLALSDRLDRHRPASRRAALSSQGWPHARRHVPRWLSRMEQSSQHVKDPRFNSDFWRRVARVTRQPAPKRVIVLGALSAIGGGDRSSLCGRGRAADRSAAAIVERLSRSATISRVRGAAEAIRGLLDLAAYARNPPANSSDGRCPRRGRRRDPVVLWRARRPGVWPKATCRGRQDHRRQFHRCADGASRRPISWSVSGEARSSP